MPSTYPAPLSIKDPAAAKAKVSPFSSLRARLTLVMVLALVPASLFLVFDALATREQIHDNAQSELIRLTEAVATAYDRQIDEAERVLAAVSLYPEVQNGDAAACSQRLAQMVDLYDGRYPGFAVINLNGEMFCTSALVTTTIQLGDRHYFQQAVRTGRFAIGEFAISRPSGLATLGLGYPVLDADGKVTRVVAHALLLNTLQAEAGNLPLPPDAVLTITDRNGTILARAPDGDRYMGQPQPDPSLHSIHASGVVDAVGIDGVQRVYAVAPILGPTGADVWLSIGRTPDAMYAGELQTIVRDLLGIGAIVLLVIAAAWAGSNRLLLSRIEQLAAVSQQLAQGDLNARAPVGKSDDELDQLATTFNDMSSALRARATEAAQRAEHLRLAMESSRLVVWTWDPVRNQVETTDNFVDIYGLPAIHFVEQGMAMVHPADRARHEQTVMSAASERLPYRSEFRIIRPDNNKVVWIDERAVYVPTGEGGPPVLAGLAMDITERKEAEEQLRTSEARLARLQTVTAELANALTEDQVVEVILERGATILDASTLALMTLSADGQWLEQRQSYNLPDSLADKYSHFPLAVHTPLADAVRTGVPTWIETKRDYLSRYPHLTGDVESVPFEAMVALPLRLSERTFGGLGLGFASPHAFDADEREYLLALAGQCAQALERARLYAAEQQARLNLEYRVRERTSELERSNRELNQFAYVASHDLKAPLRAIDHLANWITQDTADILPSTSLDHLAKLRGRVRRMEKLLDDLLAYSRAGRVQPAVEQVDVTALVQDVTALLAPPSGFTVNAVQPLPQLYTPRASLELVLRNLIGNGIKHHESGTGHVWVSAREVNKPAASPPGKDAGMDGKPSGEPATPAAMIEFAVRDDGPGIDPEYHEKIFEMFRTLQPRDQVEGSGMGLAIVKKLVESYGGTITVESEPGAGATFRFTWPRWMEEHPKTERNGAVREEPAEKSEQLKATPR